MQGPKHNNPQDSNNKPPVPKTGDGSTTPPRKIITRPVRDESKPREEVKRDTPPPPLQQQQRQLPYNRFQPPPSEKDNYRINDEIRGVKEVRLIGDNVPEEGIYSFNIALEMAEERELDLVEIARNATPPVCRIIDYTKFLYDKKRRDKEIKQKAQKTIIKEIRFTPETDDHDIEFKTKHAERFLEEGAKVKAYVSFKGRGILFKDRGELLLLKFADKLKEHGSLEQLPKLEGKRMFIFITPKKKK